MGSSSQGQRPRKRSQTIATPEQRELIAAFFRLKSKSLATKGAATRAAPAPSSAEPAGAAIDVTMEKDISPRMRQTLQRLLYGDSEKQIASKLQISRHTVHVYVKQLYKKYEVNSRGELFARWMRRMQEEKYE